MVGVQRPEIVGVPIDELIDVGDVQHDDANDAISIIARNVRPNWETVANNAAKPSWPATSPPARWTTSTPT